MVRLVFRPLTHVRRTICTSVSLRASTRVSSGFTLRAVSSPSFGSHHVDSDSHQSLEWAVDAATLRLRIIYFHCALRFFQSNARRHNSLLGPCFKTGDIKPFRQHPEHADGLALPKDSRMQPACRLTLSAPRVHQLPRRGTCFLPQSKPTYATRGYNSYTRECNSPSSCLSPPPMN